MSEHKPITDAELAEWEYGDEYEYDFHEANIDVVPRLIAEVRRLREENAEMLSAASEGKRALGHALSTVEIDALLEADKHRSRRTLTLPNGTVVRAGDVLVNGSSLQVVRATAVGNRLWLAEDVPSGEEILILSPNWCPWSEVYPDRPVPGGNQ